MRSAYALGLVAAATVTCGGQSDGSPQTLTTEIQATPFNLVSDGTSLYWDSASGAGGPLSSIPITGGSPKTVVAGTFGGSSDLAVDGVNIYFQGQTGQIFYAPKDGSGSPTAVTQNPVGGWTVVGSTLYWLESDGAKPPTPTTLTVNSAALPNGAATPIATYKSTAIETGGNLAVTSTTVFLSSLGGGLSSFPIASGIPAGGSPAPVAGTSFGCQWMIADADAVYCDTAATLVRVASDGTTTQLGTIDTNALGGLLALDDTYVYWVDGVTVGTVMRVPKIGGTPTVLARDTTPVSVAVDATNVYWADDGGNIMRMPK